MTRRPGDVASQASTIPHFEIRIEDWGLRRFFVRDPNGAVINVTQHR